MELFENKKKEPEKKENNQDIGEISSKLRLLEERYSLIRRKMQLTEQNLIVLQKDVDDEIKSLNEQVAEFKRTLHKMSDEADVLLNRINEFARAEDVKIIAKYLEYINPTRFITKEDAEKMVNDLVGRIKERRK